VSDENGDVCTRVTHPPGILVAHCHLMFRILLNIEIIDLIWSSLARRKEETIFI
jgi:hypothetical protein